MTNGRNKCDEINGCGKFYNQHLNKCPYCGVDQAFSDFVPYNPHDWIYDLESYPNVFTASFKHVNTGHRMRFVISDWVNQLDHFVDFIYLLQEAKCRMIGFNNIHYDYPVVHFILEHYEYRPTAKNIFTKSMSIINTSWERRFDNVIYDSEIQVPQIDLFKVHHFDNKARRTSLKTLEFNMRMYNISDLPYEPGTILTREQVPFLLAYNDHDVDATEKFYIESLDAIEFREELSEKYGVNMLNYNDTKIGKEYLIRELEKAIPGVCYEWTGGQKTMRQTWRDVIDFKNVILPYIQFEQPEFQRIHHWLLEQKITETKGVFTDLEATIDGFKFVFGVGGIHGSIPSQTIHSTNTHVLYDWDVASYYPNIAIKNRFFPEHLSGKFCDIYHDIYLERKKHKKGTAINAALKLALNGSYGDSNSKYSPLYDPQFTMKITVNGQLLLCMLAEQLMKIPDLKMIQINTDGLTVLCPRGQIEIMESICDWWQKFTCLELEKAIYSRMMIRDVNNYIGEYENGKLKRKGAYEYKRNWSQNHSALIVPKAAEAALIHNKDIREFVTNHQDIFDFMLRAKVSRNELLMLGQREIQKISRYYVSIDGAPLVKVSPPAKGFKIGQWKRASKLTDQYYNSIIQYWKNFIKECNEGVPFMGEVDSTGIPWDERINTKNRSKYEERRTNFESGYLITECNDIRKADRTNLNFDYYIAEVEKLVKPIRG